ncbi:hypothetical protein LB515_02470 [Mesorhizobium sp. CA15]|uniref:hypothetical protein n=1 Tax=Mesorhizobium sp. CA15 TaxID=2876641 RepID=UPI001CD16965|nr:hypothetical protein [Mesorhizobium sp. CA15]MBZ9864231.1 hypothetical protein [Mesorhizobium sp. CA15]
MVKTPAPQLPEDATAWMNSLKPTVRAEIDRLMKETGVVSFAKYWREHRSELEELERSFDTNF